jgi:hypothetical protein
LVVNKLIILWNAPSKDTSRASRIFKISNFIDWSWKKWNIIKEGAGEGVNIALL